MRLLLLLLSACVTYQSLKRALACPRPQINKLDKAVAAANTFYLANPDHAEMRQNLEYYSSMSGVRETDFKDLEARPHMVRRRDTRRAASLGV